MFFAFQGFGTVFSSSFLHKISNSLTAHLPQHNIWLMQKAKVQLLSKTTNSLFCWIASMQLRIHLKSRTEWETVEPVYLPGDADPISGDPSCSPQWWLAPFPEGFSGQDVPLQQSSSSLMLPVKMAILLLHLGSLFFSPYYCSSSLKAYLVIENSRKIALFVELMSTDLVLALFCCGDRQMPGPLRENSTGIQLGRE